MLIGVVSDTHNNFKNIEKITKNFNAENVAIVVHTGDITNAYSLDKFSTLKCDLIGVYGNNDKNEFGLEECAIKNNFQFQDPPKIVNFCNKKIAIFHEPDPIDDFLRKYQDIDIVLHGHTHRYRNEIKKNTLFFNPGESAGMLEGKNAIGIIDLKDLKTRRIFF